MNTYRVIDKASWPRRELFDVYWKFDNPGINVSVTCEAQALYDCAKKRGLSFFLLSLYAILRAANRVPQMRQRVLGTEIVEFDRIAIMTPIMTEQELFQQIWCEYQPDFTAFLTVAEPLVAAVARGEATPTGEGEDFICASCLPWLHFTHVTQADLAFHQAVPILAWGKMKDGKIPLSCKFSHAFMDGLHVSRFFGNIEESFGNPERLWEVIEI